MELRPRRSCDGRKQPVNGSGFGRLPAHGAGNDTAHPSLREPRDVGARSVLPVSVYMPGAVPGAYQQRQARVHRGEDLSPPTAQLLHKYPNAVITQHAVRDRTATQVQGETRGRREG